jgi:hypothetical protein
VYLNLALKELEFLRLQRELSGTKDCKNQFERTLHNPFLINPNGCQALAQTSLSCHMGDKTGKVS